MPAAESSLRITEAYRSRLFAIRGGLEGRAVALWNAADDLNDFTWTNRAAAAVEQAQNEAVALTGGYLSAFLSSEVGTRTRGPTLDRKRYSGLSRDGRPLRDALRSPMIGFRLKLAEGEPVEAALKFGLDRAKRMVSVDYDHAHRTALTDGLAADERFQGWQRAVTGTCGACAGDIAVEVRTELPSIPLNVHPNCQCVTEPVVAPRSPAVVLAERAISTQRAVPGRNFTEDDWDVVNATYSYFGAPQSFTINRYARTGELGENLYDLSEDLVRDTIRGLDTAIDHAGALGAPVRVYRGLKGEVGAKPGEWFEDKGFGSTSANSKLVNAQEQVDTVLELDVHPDVKALWGGNPLEEELLLQRGVRYVIESVEKQGKQWRVKAKVLPPE